MSNKIKVLLVDDHAIVRNGLKMLLELDERLEICGEASTLKETITMVNSSNPDVILLDFKLPDGDGIIGCNNIKRISPDTKVIILTAYADDHIVIEAIRAGADGYLLKSIESEELVEAIISVYKGDSILDPSVTDSVFNELKIRQERLKKGSKLSQRELKILEMISQGKTNKEIAEYLYISDKTVRNYISNIFRKLNVSNRTEAAGYWIRNKNIE